MKLTSTTIEELVVTLGRWDNLKPAWSRLDTVAAHLSPVGLSPRWRSLVLELLPEREEDLRRGS